MKTVKKIATFVALGLISANYGFTQTSVWKVSKGNNEIYLGGSVHLLRSIDFPLPTEFDVAFAKANTLVFEADVKDPEITSKMLSESRLPDGQTLENILTAAQYRAIADAAEELDVPMSLLERMKPGVAIMTLSAMSLQKLDISAAGVDMYYYDMAESKGKSVDFLESIYFQLDLIYNIPFDIGEFIEYSLEDMQQINIETEFSKMIEEWRAGKEITTDELTKMKTKYPSVYKAMFSDRNRKWLPKIEKYIADAGVEFIIVGSAHLWGDDGLLALLRKKGYTIVQLRVKSKND
jgi:uncharacterized protein YbaP (TraB family)